MTRRRKCSKRTKKRNGLRHDEKFACSGKRRYFDKGGAIQAALMHVGKHGGRHKTTYLRAYQCDKCHGGWHLTKERRDVEPSGDGIADYVEVKNEKAETETRTE